MSKVLMFTAEWCGQCKNLKRELERLPEYEVELVDIETEAGTVLKDDFGIRGLPTLIKVGPDGRSAGALVGARHNRDKLIAFFEG